MSYIRESDGKEIFSQGFAHYTCKACGQTTTRYYENSIHGVEKCEVCAASVVLTYYEPLKTVNVLYTNVITGEEL